MNIKEIFQSKNIKHILFILFCAIVLIIVFQAGVMVGFKKAGFLSNTGDNFFRHFDGRGMMEYGAKGGPNGGQNMKPGFENAFRGMMRDEFPGGHGAGGKIVSINLPNFTIIGNDNVEKVVNISEDTKIMRFREEIKPEDLKVDDQAVILGVPATSTAIISAKLIRVMPEF